MTNFTNVAVPVLILIISSLLSYASLRKWVKEQSTAAEEIFYWGLSLAILALSLVLYFIYPLLSAIVLPINLVFAINALVIASLWLQLFAIGAIKYHKHSSRKCLRFIMWVILISIVVVISLVTPSSTLINKEILFIGLTSIGVVLYDLAIQYTCLTLSVGIVSLLIPLKFIRREYTFLLVGYMCLVAYFIINIFHIIIYNHQQMCIGYTEMLFMSSCVILVAASIADLIFIKK